MSVSNYENTIDLLCILKILGDPQPKIDHNLKSSTLEHRWEMQGLLTQNVYIGLYILLGQCQETSSDC